MCHRQRRQIHVAPFIHLIFQGFVTKVVFNICVHQMHLLSRYWHAQIFKKYSKLIQNYLKGPKYIFHSHSP
jgi:hypothetical protein